MYIKKELIRYETRLTSNATYKFDEFPETGLSAGLLLTIDTPINAGEHLNPVQDDDKLRLIDWITKVQILTDGKRPLKDLSGPVAQALEYWNTGQTTPDRIRDLCVSENRCFIPIAWGRKLGDIEYALNWAKYGSIELDLTNIATDRPLTNLDLTIENLKIVNPAPGAGARGIFQERIWREYTTVQNQTKYLKPPAGNKYRRIILRCVPDMEASHPYRRSRSFYHLAEEIKLGFKDYSEIAFDGYGEQLMEQNSIEFPELPRTSGEGLAEASDAAIRTGIGQRLGTGLAFSEMGTTLTEANFGVYPYTDDLMVIMTDAAGEGYVWWKVNGRGYNNTLALLFDRFGPDHYLDSVRQATVNLDIKTENHADAAGGVNQVILSELVPR